MTVIAPPTAAPLHTRETCQRSLSAVRDTLYVMSGKWKLPILIALQSGPKRFRELQRELGDITPKVLSKELKELELNDFLTRTVHPTTPVTVEYARTPYGASLDPVICAMREWGTEHRRRIGAGAGPAGGGPKKNCKTAEAELMPQ